MSTASIAASTSPIICRPSADSGRCRPGVSIRTDLCVRPIHDSLNAIARRLRARGDNGDLFTHEAIH